MSTIVQDIKFGLRVLWKKPGFTVVAVLSLALGIGANTAIFTLVDTVLIKTLPVRQPEQLVLFGNGRDMGVSIGLPNSSFDLFSYPFYRQVQQRTDVFAGVASLLSLQWNMHGFVNTNGSSSEIEQMKVQLVSGTYFPVLGVNAGLGRLRLVRQLFTEGALLALFGAIIGVALSWWGSRLLLVMASDGPEAVPVDVTPNLRVLGFTIGVSALCAIVFGAAPALRAARTEPNTSLKNKTSSALKNPLGKTFVVVQVALSLLLLVGAGLFVRTLINLQSLPTGFNQENAMLFTVDTSATGYKAKDPRLGRLLRDVEDHVRSVPGVQAASFATYTFNQGLWTTTAYTSAQNSLTDDARTIRNNVVGQDFFAAMGLPIVLGRGFGPQDTEKSQKVAVISESLAQRFFPNTSPLGKHFGADGPSSTEQIEVVGVVKDARYQSLTEELAPIAFYPHSQNIDSLLNFVVRFSGPASNVVPKIRQTIKQVDRNLPIDDVVSLSDQIGRALVQQKLVARLATFFGLLALLLACVGLYGVMSYGVARRTNEIGIRMALGAPGRSVLWLVLREALLLVGIGLVVGVLASLAVTKTAASLLYELKPNDPLTIAGATLLLAAVALVAGYLPARRASKVDPLVALREE